MGILSADLNALRYFIDHIISNMAHIISMARPAYITISITITFLNENKRFYKFVLSLVNRLCISDIADGLLPLHFGKHTDAGTVTGYCDFTVDDFHSVEAVVGYEQVAVKVVGKNAEVVEPVHVFSRNGTASQLLRGVWVKA